MRKLAPYHWLMGGALLCALLVGVLIRAEFPSLGTSKALGTRPVEIKELDKEFGLKLPGANTSNYYYFSRLHETRLFIVLTYTTDAEAKADFASLKFQEGKTASYTRAKFLRDDELGVHLPGPPKDIVTSKTLTTPKNHTFSAYQDGAKIVLEKW